jgi:hypothetical protein
MFLAETRRPAFQAIVVQIKMQRDGRFMLDAIDGYINQPVAVRFKVVPWAVPERLQTGIHTTGYSSVVFR